MRIVWASSIATAASSIQTIGESEITFDEVRAAIHEHFPHLHLSCLPTITAASPLPSGRWVERLNVSARTGVRWVESTLSFTIIITYLCGCKCRQSHTFVISLAYRHASIFRRPLHSRQSTTQSLSLFAFSLRPLLLQLRPQLLQRGQALRQRRVGVVVGRVESVVVERR